MNAIERIINVPTSCSNCVCAHCVQDQRLLDTEVSSALISEKIVKGAASLMKQETKSMFGIGLSSHLSSS